MLVPGGRAHAAAVAPKDPRDVAAPVLAPSRPAGRASGPVPHCTGLALVGAANGSGSPFRPTGWGSEPRACANKPLQSRMPPSAPQTFRQEFAARSVLGNGGIDFVVASTIA